MRSDSNLESKKRKESDQIHGRIEIYSYLVVSENTIGNNSYCLLIAQIVPQAVSSKNHKPDDKMIMKIKIRDMEWHISVMT
jgi:hypothetical protein